MKQGGKKKQTKMRPFYSSNANTSFYDSCLKKFSDLQNYIQSERHVKIKGGQL
jgi:hypothetical protein